MTTDKGFSLSCRNYITPHEGGGLLVAKVVAFPLPTRWVIIIVFFFPDNPFPAGYSSFHGSKLVISTPKDNCLSLAGCWLRLRGFLLPSNWLPPPGEIILPSL
ncbi:MAG: hypothetical protein N3D76_01285 [Geminocystis sp.]|nr:hypothetical protein [Geminocystis sp.]